MNLASEHDLLDAVYAAEDDEGFDAHAASFNADADTHDLEDAFDMDAWVARAQHTARDLADMVSKEVHNHPVRTLAIAGAAGFLLASTTRVRILPALVKSGVGIAAAMALRQAAELGLDSLGFTDNEPQRDAAE